jgi:hypothetical protein
MIVNLQIKISMRNGDKKLIEIEENNPKGYLIDKSTGEKKEVELTPKQVKLEYSKKIIENIEKKKPVFLMDKTGTITILNSYDISSFDILVIK